MSRKARLILAVTMTSVMVFMVTLVATYLNIGLRPDFIERWVKAYFVAWPIAAGTAFLVMPISQRFTAKVVGRIEGHA